MANTYDPWAACQTREDCDRKLCLNDESVADERGGEWEGNDETSDDAWNDARFHQAHEHFGADCDSDTDFPIYDSLSAPGAVSLSGSVPVYKNLI